MQFVEIQPHEEPFDDGSGSFGLTASTAGSPMSTTSSSPLLDPECGHALGVLEQLLVLGGILPMQLKNLQRMAQGRYIPHTLPPSRKTLPQPTAARVAPIPRIKVADKRFVLALRQLHIMQAALTEWTSLFDYIVLLRGSLARPTAVVVLEVFSLFSPDVMQTVFSELAGTKWWQGEGKPLRLLAASCVGTLNAEELEMGEKQKVLQALLKAVVDPEGNDEGHQNDGEDDCLTVASSSSFATAITGSSSGETQRADSTNFTTSFNPTTTTTNSSSTTSHPEQQPSLRPPPLASSLGVTECWIEDDEIEFLEEDYKVPLWHCTPTTTTSTSGAKKGKTCRVATVGSQCLLDKMAAFTDRTVPWDAVRAEDVEGMLELATLFTRRPNLIQVVPHTEEEKNGGNSGELEPMDDDEEEAETGRLRELLGIDTNPASQPRWVQLGKALKPIIVPR